MTTQTQIAPGAHTQSVAPTGAEDHMIKMRRRGGAWREEVWDRIGRYRDAVNRDFQSMPEARRQIAEHLTEAESIANDSHWKWLGRKCSWIEAVWRELRLAEEAMVADCEDSKAVLLAQDAVTHGVRYLGSSDSRVVDLQDLVKGQLVDFKKVRDQTVLVLTEAHKSSDASHRAMSAVGKQLTLWTVWLAGLALLTVLGLTQLGWRFLPAVSDGAKGSIGGWQTVLLAMMAGLVGAMFTAVPSISLIPDKGEPFNPVWRQATLKMAIGAWSGFVGVLAVVTGLAEPLVAQATASGSTSGLISLPGFVMTAALFGASQEAISRFADRKASVARDIAA